MLDEEKWLIIANVNWMPGRTINALVAMSYLVFKKKKKAYETGHRIIPIIQKVSLRLKKES